MNLSGKRFRSTQQIDLADWIINMYDKQFLQQQMLVYKNKLLYSTEYLEMYEVFSTNHPVNTKIKKDKKLDNILI